MKYRLQSGSMYVKNETRKLEALEVCTNKEKYVSHNPILTSSPQRYTVNSWNILLPIRSLSHNY